MDGFQALYAFFGWCRDMVLTDQMSLVLQVTLAMVFALSGVHKLRNPVAAATSASRFGLPVRPTKTIGLALAGAELSVAAVLLVPISSIALVALCVAAVLSLAFVILTARALIRGESFDCNCLGSGKVSRTSVARAGAMLVASIVAAAGLVTNGARTVGVETASTAIGLALIVVGLSYLARLITRVRRLREEFDKDVDWAWMVQELYTQKGV
jgi:uncharacterized membrane protein YphA (DoxX/SURF4 family)